MKCEHSVGYSVVAYSNMQSSIRLFARKPVVCEILLACRLDGTDCQNIGSIGLDLKADKVKTLGWEWQRERYSDRRSYGFPVLAIGHGILWANTVVWVNKAADRAVIVQAGLTQLCGEGKTINTPLCSDTNKALTDIALRVSQINYKN